MVTRPALTRSLCTSPRSAPACLTRRAGARLYRSPWMARWGKEVAEELDAEIREGFKTFKTLVAEFRWNAQSGGHLLVAHRDKKLAWMQAETRVLRKDFGHQTRMLSRDKVAEPFVKGADCHGCDARVHHSISVQSGSFTRLGPISQDRPTNLVALASAA
jgi:hypothetical protein